MLQHWIWFVVVLAIAIALFHKGHTPITGKLRNLPDTQYDIKPATAPVATNHLLKLISFLFTQSRFGPSILRHLLDANGIINLRELGSEITLPTLYYPMRRLSKEELSVYYQESNFDNGTIANAIQFGMSQDDDHSKTTNKLKSIEDYARFYRSGKGFPSAIMKKTVQTIKDWKSQGFPIFSMIKEEDVMRQAHASDERFKQGQPLSIFDGVPIAFKDSMDIVNHTFYSGQSPLPEFQSFHHQSTRDEIIIKRFRDLGAIIVGLTIMTEGGCSPLGYNAHFQGPISTFSSNRYSGGSSGGSGVAVATGLVPVAIGFDGGGSIRLPSTMNGAHGLATTFGRCPFEQNLDSALIKSGPIASSSADVAITYAIMAQQEMNHFYSDLYDGSYQGLPQPHLTGYHNIHALQDVKVGIFPEWLNDSDSHIRDRCYEVITYLKSQGVKVVELKIPQMRSLHLAHGLKIASEFAMTFDRAYHANPSGLEPSTRITTGLGKTVTALEILGGEKLKAFAFDYITKLFKEHSNLYAILTPTIGVDVPILSNDAKIIGESDTALNLVMTKHMFMANFLGLPAYSVPIGFLPPKTFYQGESKELRLPVGLQLLGDHWKEHQLIRLAHAIEKGFTNPLLAKEEPKRQFFAQPF